MALFHGWGVTSELVNFGSNTPAFSKKEVGLQMLNLIYYIMRRSGLGGQKFPAGKIYLDNIILGCLRVAYEEGLTDKQSVLPFNM